MGFKAIAKSIVLRADLFSAAATFRIRGEPVYESLCGGFVSIIVIAAFIGIFAQSFINLVSRVEIKART